MSATPAAGGRACIRARRTLSLLLDGERLPRRGPWPASHLRDCPACREAADRIVGFTQALRSAPLECTSPAA